MHCIIRTNMLKTRRTLIQATAALCVAAALMPARAVSAQTLSEVLRIQVNGKPVLGEADLQNRKFADPAQGMAEFKKNIVTLRRNASVQLKVEVIDVQGRATDVTANPATSYQSLAPSRLSVSTDGLVTAAPTPGAPPGISGDLAVLVVHEQRGQEAWNKMFFNIVP